MWNNITLRPPPINSFSGSANLIDAAKLTKSLGDLSTVIKYCEKPLLLEETLLFNVICKFKTRLRKHMEIKFMTKLKKHLERYNQINLVNDIDRLSLSIPSKTTGQVYLPTKQMIEYLLVRLQGHAKILSRIIELSAETAKYTVNRLMIGHYWTMALVVLSIVSRVWEICHHVIEASCDCYRNVIPARSKLQLFGVQWLEEDYVFPTDLREWLGLTWTLDDMKLLTDKKLDITTYVISDDEDDDIQYMFSYKNDCIVIDDTMKLNDNDVEFINEYIDIIDTSRNSKFDLFQTRKESIIDVESDNSADSQRKDSDVEIVTENAQQTFNDDIGEVVNRDDASLHLVTSTPIRDQHTKKQRKRKRSCEIEIQKSILQCVQKLSTNFASPANPSACEAASPVKAKRLRSSNKSTNNYPNQADDTESVISVSDSSEISQKLIQSNKSDKSVIILDETCTDLHASDAEVSLQSTTLRHSPEKTITIQASELSQSDTEIGVASSNDATNGLLLTIEQHNLKNITSIKDFNTFLITEKFLRSTNHPLRVTANVDRNGWKKMMKAIGEVFVTRKRLKQDKKLAVKLAKSIVKAHLK